MLLNEPPFVSTTRCYELVAARKRLEHGTLPERDGAVLLGVTEATIAESEELRRNRR